VLIGRSRIQQARAKDGAKNAPWKNKKRFSTFAPARRLDVRIEESWSQLGRIDGWWNG